MSETPEITQPVSPSLSDSESRILRHLIALRDQASGDVATFIGHALTARNIDMKQYGISLSDFKSIVKNSPANNPPPSA